jgi:predicted nuclease with TOPRIM domain
MKEQLTARLEKLKGEFESGQKMLADLEAKQANLQQTLLRISGAIQVLEELLVQESQPEVEVNESTPRPLEKIEAAA